MTDHRSPPPPAEDCLVTTYASRGVKGGTIIAEDVTDLAMHEKLVWSGGYRPVHCEKCGGWVHVHDYRTRVLAGSGLAGVMIVRFRCAALETCGAVFSVLPAFVARHLWRTWETVEQAVRPREPVDEPQTLSVPATTRARWMKRLAASAAALVVGLSATRFGAQLAAGVGLGGTRAEAVAAYAATAPAYEPVFASLAGVTHRTAPGLRLM